MEYKMVKKMRAGGGTQISDEKRGRAYDRARVNEKVAKDYREAKGINKPFAKVTELAVNAVQKLKGDSPDGDKPRDRYQTKRDFEGIMSKDAKQKAATNKAVSVAMDSKYEGKINPPKEPDMGVAKARMSRPTGPDRKEMAYNRRRSASEGRTVSKMSMGGKARGMGAATKGGSFSKNG
jgi:hypothetical protein